MRRRPDRALLSLLPALLAFVAFGVARVDAPVSLIGLLFDRPVAFAATGSSRRCSRTSSAITAGFIRSPRRSSGGSRCRVRRWPPSSARCAGSRGA